MGIMPSANACMDFFYKLATPPNNFIALCVYELPYEINLASGTDIFLKSRILVLVLYDFLKSTYEK